MKDAHLHIRQAMVEALSQGLRLLDALTDDDYREKVAAAFHASIGEHYRHCLEHFEPLFHADGGLIDYDARPRDARLENDRACAITRTHSLLAACRTLPTDTFDRLVQMRCKVSCAGGVSPVVPTTLGREAVSAVLHAIHHYAMIGVICHLLGIKPPGGFGVAPATLAHRRGAVAAA